jgi:hypothetical protein
MATNALLIEFGAEGAFSEEAMTTIESVIGMLSGWKKAGTIEEFRFYPIVTGNRSQRVAMILLELSHEQLEQLVVSKEYPQLMDTIAATCTNLTTSRAITLERMLELSKQIR